MAYDVQKELRWPGPLSKGMKSADVKRLQEWLRVRDPKLAIGLDGDYGRLTANAVEAFQRTHGLAPTGEADVATLDSLTEPLRRAISPIAMPPGTKLGEATARYAEFYATLGLREIVPNLGPIVRFFMRGPDGNEWAWCAGAVRQLCDQAAATIGSGPLPFAMSVGCARLARNAQRAGRFIQGKTASHDRDLRGTIFVIPQPDGKDWTHTGIVTGRIDDEFVSTIEGNTNLAGSREGTDMIAQRRRWRKMDYLLLDGPA